MFHYILKLFIKSTEKYYCLIFKDDMMRQLFLMQIGGKIHKQFLISIKYEFIKKSNSVDMKKVAEGLELEIRSSVI